MAENSAVVGIYHSHTNAEASIKELQRSGFDMKKLSIVGKDYQTEAHVVGYYNAGDRMKLWGKRGLFGAAFGGYCLDRPCLWCLVSARSSFSVLWSLGSSAHWRVPSS